MDAHASNNRGSPFSISKDDHRNRARPLAPDETKSEQARLLTLLRTIHPVTIVDQICKAVAYFGGIPGAPPPEDGIFPESANTRETGALFIGWIAEIFPDVNAHSPEIPKDVIQSQGKKKKSHSKGKTGPSNGETGLSNEPPNSRNGYGFGPAVSAPGWGLPQSLALVNTPIPAAPIPLPEPGSRQVAISAPEQNKPAEHQSPYTPSKLQLEEVPDSTASGSKRRRGRPKGSRNKGRADGHGDLDTADQNHVQAEGQDQGQQVHQASQAPQAQMTASQTTQPAPQNAQNTNTFSTATVNNPAPAKPSPALAYVEQSWQGNSQQNQPVGSMTVPGDELSPEELRVLEAFRQNPPDGMTLVPSPVVTAKPTPEVGQKRKRAPPKPKANPPPAPAPAYSLETQQPVQNPTALSLSDDNTMGIAKDALQWGNMNTTGSINTTTPTAPTASAPPPAKRPRQRKPKAPPANEPPSRTQTASVVSSATPPTAPSTIPDSQAGSSQQNVSMSRPPAEGLEAHYERFQNFSSQQNGRQTPTLLQQQVRQQPKPSSVTSQQSTPQMQQQQMQPQKSQQSSSSQQSMQRDEQKMTQATTARSSSTAYYNQRSQASSGYNQQYPSHQVSQLYGTSQQASPQMSTNAYRTPSNAMAQASPQFSQTESSYRTASPHTTIAQPSPSFSQANASNFRTNSISQPSPSYSQAENTYRTPSTHSMAQPSASYSSARSQTQTQPSQQNHYSHFSTDSSYIDLPTLESLGHSGSSATSVGLATQGFGQQSLGVGLGSSARSTASTNSNSLYGTSSATNNSLYGTSSGLNNAFDTTTSDLLRGVSRSSNANTGYGSTSSGLSNAYHSSTSEHELQERLLRGLGRR
jgi:hypothetical protein